MSTPDDVLRIFCEIGRAMARGHGYDPLIRAVVRASTSLTDADAGSVLVLDPATGNLIYRSGHRMTGPERTISFAPGEGVAGWVALHGRSARVADVARDRRFVKKSGQRRAIGSLLCVPVTVRSKAVGVLTVTSAKRNAFARLHTRLLTALAGQVALDLENVRLEALATRDPLTGIANRRRFDERLDQLLAEGRPARAPIAVLMLDLDRFKSINDRHGHPAGDAVLQQAVQRWTDSLRGNDLLARMGGEEFGLLLPGADSRRAVEVAERLRARVEHRPFRVRRLSIAVTVSVGVAVSPRGAGTPGRLLADADRALYAAKEGGRNRVVLARRGGHSVTA